MFFYFLVIIFLAKSGFCTEQTLVVWNGELEDGNSHYKQINVPGRIIISINSVQGDADLYVSETNPKPNYEPDSYDLQSATCGVDTVEIPSSFKRPFHVGIYAHPSHKVTEYYLKISKLPEEEDVGPLEQSEQPKKAERKRSTKKDREGTSFFTKAYIWTILEIMEAMFC